MKSDAAMAKSVRGEILHLEREQVRAINWGDVRGALGASREERFLDCATRRPTNRGARKGRVASLGMTMDGARRQGHSKSTLYAEVLRLIGQK